MKNYSKKILSIFFVLMLTSNAFAVDFRVESFNGISPQSHLNKVFTNERKEELKRNIIVYNDIEDMIRLYNPEVQSMWNSWENHKSSNDVYNDYNEAADALEGGGGDSEVADAMAKAQATGMRIQADMNYSDSYTDFLANYASEMKLVLSTKILYFECFRSENAFRNSEEEVREAERKVKSAEVGYANGASTYVDLLTAKKFLSDVKAAYTIALSDYNNSRRKMFINCGKAMNADATIVKEDINYLYDVASINFEDDLKKALINNFQYEIYKKGKENAVTEEVKKQMDININAAENKIYNDLQTKYSTLLNSVESYWNYDMAKKLANETYNQAKNSYANGNISKNEMLTSEYEYNMACADFDGAIYDVNIAYITYKAAVEGLASC